MQRLFSTFADSPPGAGLLIQRLLVGTALVYCAIAKPGGSVEAPQVIGALAGILLIAGLWAPGAGVVAQVRRSVGGLIVTGPYLSSGRTCTIGWQPFQ